MRSLFVFFPFVAFASFFACSAARDGATSSAEQGDTAGDLATARRMLDLLGGADGKCVDCHTAMPADVKRWGVAMKAVDDACLSPGRALGARERIDCLRDDPANPASSFSPDKIGLYAAGAPEGDFDALFQDAFGAQAGPQLAAFRQKVTMPHTGAPLAQSDWTTLKSWVLRGMPQLEAAAGGADGGPEAGDAAVDAPSACNETTTPELRAHIARMQTEGWGPRLADLSTPMFGCGAATSALDCLSSAPDRTSAIGAAGVDQAIRELRVLGIHTEFWIRSSADGRYVGVGSAPSGIFDLSRPSAPMIQVSAAYDPFFLRSNDGFAFAGVAGGGGIVLCQQSLLADLAGASAPRVTMTEAKCTKVGSSVYESIGSALDGVSYFMTVGPHQNDDGGNYVTHPLPAGYLAPSLTTFTPMVNDGTAYRAQTPVKVDLPGEGDVMLSPSSLLAAARFGVPGNAKQVGYRVHLVKATPSGGGNYDIQTPVAAEVCMKGGKPEMSFDERFLAAHQYVDRTEADEADLPDGSSNIVVADMLTGRKYRVTTMAAGQFALYPHFRADGWLYFLVRDKNAGVETVLASDIALRLARP